MKKDRPKLKDSKLFKMAKEKFPDILGKGIEIFGDLSGKDSIENLGKWIQGEAKPSPIQQIDLDKAREQDLKELELYLKDVQSARDMQVKALEQDDKFSKRFVYYMATFWSVVGGTYLFLVTFTDVANPEHANTIIGFLLGTIVSTIINFFFGSSKSSKDKTNLLNKK